MTLGTFKPQKYLFLRAIIASAILSGSVFLQSYEFFFLGILLSVALFGFSDLLGLFLLLNGVLQFQGEILSVAPNLEAREALIALGFVALLPRTFRQLGSLRQRGRIATAIAAPWILLTLSLPGWGNNSWYQSVITSIDPMAHIVLVFFLFASNQKERLKEVALGVFSVALGTAWVSLAIGLGPNIYQDFPDLRAGGTIGHPNLTAAIAALVMISLFRKAPNKKPGNKLGIEVSILFAQLAAVSAILAAGTRSVGFTLIAFLAIHMVWEIVKSRKIDLGTNSLASFGIVILGSLVLSPMTSLFPRLLTTVVDWISFGGVPSSLSWRVSTWEGLQEDGRPRLFGPANNGFETEPHSLYLELLYTAGAIATVIFVLLCLAILGLSVVGGNSRVGFYWLFGLLVGFTDPILLWSGFGFSLVTLSIIDWETKSSGAD